MARGLSPEQLDLDLVDSPEYFAARGGGSNDGFLDALFADALGRAVDAGARTAFDTMFANGATPAQVADLVFGSTEYQNRLVENIFESLLNRPADPAALVFFTAELSSGLTDQQMMAQVIGSEEFAPLA